jgi:hypothetical protein
MNKELLDKLQFQAAAQVNPLLKDREWQRVYIQKYTELIVRECAGVVNSRDDSDTGFWANIIKEHFGVEE